MTEYETIPQHVKAWQWTGSEDCAVPMWLMRREEFSMRNGILRINRTEGEHKLNLLQWVVIDYFYPGGLKVWSEEEFGERYRQKPHPLAALSKVGKSPFKENYYQQQERREAQ